MKTVMATKVVRVTVSGQPRFGPLILPMRMVSTLTLVQKRKTSVVSMTPLNPSRLGKKLCGRTETLTGPFTF